MAAGGLERAEPGEGLRAGAAGLGLVHHEELAGGPAYVDGLSESLGQEVAGFGLHVTAIAPGSFRTGWAGRSMTRAPRTIADYDALFDPLRQARHEAGGHG